MICRWVSSHRSMTVNCFGSSSFKSFKTFLLHFHPECFHLKSMILQRVSFGINVRYVLQPLGVFNQTKCVTYFHTGVPSLWIARSISKWKNTRSRHVAQSGRCPVSHSNRLFNTPNAQNLLTHGTHSMFPCHPR
jgi:hypothetical protein